MANPARPIPEMSDKDIERFWKLMNKGTRNECWIWTGDKDKGNYGRFSINNKQYPAHRVSYYLHYGQPPIEKTLDHTCHDLECRIRCKLRNEICPHRACVNPLHLESETVGNNVSRTNKGIKRDFCRNGHLRTSENTRYNKDGSYKCKVCEKITADRNRERRTINRKALKTNTSEIKNKLSYEQAQTILKRYENGETNKAALAREYKVDPAVIRGIVAGKLHVNTRRPNQILDSDSVYTMRLEFTGTRGTIKSIAIKYNVSHATATRVLRNIVWYDPNYIPGIGFKES